MVAPDKKQWQTVDLFQWIQFRGLTAGLTIKGNGIFDGRGQSWWIAANRARPHVSTYTIILFYFHIFSKLIKQINFVLARFIYNFKIITFI